MGLLLLPVALAVPLIFLGIPTVRKKSDGLVFAALLIFLNAVGFIVLAGEIYLTATAFPLFNFIVIVVVACVGIGAYRQHGAAVALWLHGLFLAAYLALMFTDLTPVKPYRRFYNSIRPGMTRAQVMQALHRQFPKDGRYPVPVLRNAADSYFEMMFFLDPNQGAYNAEGVFITMSNELVASKSYSPD